MRTVLLATVAVLVAGACRSTAPAAPAAEARGADASTDEGPQAIEPPGVDAAETADNKAPDGTAGEGGDATDGAAETPFFVLLGGDLMGHPLLHTIAKEHGDGDIAAGWAWILRELAPIRRRLAALGRVAFVANLEFPTATEREKPRHWPPLFNGPPEALAGLRAAGIDAVTVANNHAFDQHREGLGETVAAAHAAGLRTAGGGNAAETRTPLALSDAAPRILLLDYAWTLQPAGSPPDDALPRIATLDDAVDDDVRAAKDDADVLIVVVHWMGEFQTDPLPVWREWAERLAAAGADAVVCHGPHVVGPIDFIQAEGRTVPVVFSLGNLVSNMGWGVQPGVPPTPGEDSEFRIEARVEALAALRVVPTATEHGPRWAIDGLWVVPLWLDDNRPFAEGPERRPREIFPRPMPWCAPAATDGCPAGASDRWCRMWLDMILGRRDRVLETLWGVPPEPLAPCPPEAEPYDPPPDFRPVDSVPEPRASASGHDAEPVMSTDEHR
jgi:poly-gamma-glutamate synthesis protein (capsule biosynthesis protein)